MEEYGKMVQLVITSVAMALTMGFCYQYYIKLAPAGLIKDGVRTRNNDKIGIIILLVVGLLTKMIISGMFKGFEVDMNCFKAWGNRMIEVGAKNFYSKDTFSDYPPGYLYVLGILSWICKAFKIGWNVDSAAVDWTNAATDVVFKLPACICDVAAGYFIYKIARRKLPNSTSLFCAALYIFNPAVMIDSAVWGQVDSIYVFFLVLMMYFIIEKKLPSAYIVFGIGIIVKPQMTFFTPILIWAIIEQVFLNDFSKKKFIENLSWGIGAIAIMFLFALPFGLSKVIPQFVDTVSSYPYASVNAYNFWTMIGRNWASQTDKLFFLKASVWGTIAIITMVILTFYLFHKTKEDSSRYYIFAAFLMSGVFLFSVRMHERYMYPVMVLLLFAFALKPVKEIMYAYIGFSIVQLLNVGHVLYYYDANNFSQRAMVPMLIGAGTLGMFIYLVYTIKKWYLAPAEQREAVFEKRNELIKEQIENPDLDVTLEDGEIKKEPKKKFFGTTILKSSEPLKMLKIDWIVMLVIVIVYGAIALYDLGERNTPNTEYYDPEWYSTVVMDLGQPANISKVAYYLGNNENRAIVLEGSNTGEDGSWYQISSFNMESVLCWGEHDITSSTRYLKLTCNSDILSLFELVLIDDDGNIVTPVNADDYPNLFDELDKYDEKDFRNGTYFDEVYHARTAYEYIKGRYSYENTHPPLGKAFIALGMLIFGVSPFGWRIMGTLFGIAMLPVLYLFAKKMFKKTWMAGIATTLFAFDFMHFTQTRIATIDVFVTFFVILMYFFMYCYIKRSFYDRPIAKTFVVLAASGVAMGFGVASKWTGAYAGAGLGVIFFIDLYRRYREYKFAKSDIDGTTNGISHRLVVEKFPRYTFNTLIICLIFFVFVPAIIYTLSYLPFNDLSGEGLVARMLRNQQTMFNYHSNLNATHPYSSNWYQWPFIWKPMFYYSKQISDTVGAGISAFGNPLVWYAGIPAAIYMIYLMIAKKDRNAMFLFLGYLAQYLPWMLVTRCVFIYHYFPSVPFVVMMVGYSIYKIVGDNKQRRKWAYIYVAAAVLLFAMFYPVLSGHNVSYDFVNTWLKWFDKWVLVL